MRKQTEYNQLVGRIGDSYYFCDYIFEDRGFKGAVASVLCPVSKSDYDNRHDLDNSDTLEWFRELWQWAVDGNYTEESLVSYAQDVIDDDGDDALWDLSYNHYWDALREAIPELTEDEYPVFEAAGGGRRFSPDMEWDEIYDQELWEKIKAIEVK